MTYTKIEPKHRRISAYVDMGHTLKAHRNSPEHRAMVMRRLLQLTPCEREACVLHFIEGRSQALVAEWMGVTLRNMQRHINNAVLKVPELRPLRVKSLAKIRRPKMYQLSQLGPGQRGPFNSDEL